MPYNGKSTSLRFNSNYVTNLVVRPEENLFTSLTLFSGIQKETRSAL